MLVRPHKIKRAQMEGSSPCQPGQLPGAVFLSYASQDAEAARRICEALRGAGIEVWFDRSELRGGDAWDRSIRLQIHDCALFVPIISQHTHERLEGYFRREWRLAIERAGDMAENRAFLVPVVIDDTTERDLSVPDKFRELQWTRLPGGETPPAFMDHVRRLLSPEVAALAPGSPGPKAAAADLPARGSKRVLPAAVVVVLLGIAAYLAIDKPWFWGHATQTASSTLAALPEKSIAVLPFVDMSEKHDQGYFSDGLSEELIDMLTKIPDLRVPARTSSFYFKDKSEDIATISQRLHVANVLEGSVRKSGNALRVTAQLIRADNGYHLWSETYDRELKDVFKVQDDIAGAVVTALKAHLLSMQPAAQAELRTANIEAYNEYLRGRQSFNRGDSEGYSRAVTEFSAATALDPHYAVAYVELALAQFWHADEMGDEAAYQSALASASKAVDLAPGLGAGYAVRGFVRAVYAFDFAGAMADQEKAVALSPHDADVLHRSAVVLAINGNLAAAIAREKEAFELDPLSTEICMRLGFLYVANQQLQEARPMYEKALAIAPNSERALTNLGTLELLENRPEQALAIFHQNKYEDFRLEGEAKAEYTLGHAAAAQEALRQLIVKDDRVAVAGVYAWRGENDRALEWLERSYMDRESGLTWIKIDPAFRGLRSEPRYKALLQRMNLAD